MKRAALTLLSLIAIVWTLPARAQQPEVVDEIVAVVDDEIILRSDVNVLLVSFLQQQQIPYSDELWFEALNDLINQKVLLIHARKDTTLTVSEEQLKQALDERVRILAARVGGEERLQELYGKTILQLKDEYRDEVRDQLLAQSFQQRKLQQIKITPTEVRQWFEKIPADSLPEIPETVRLAHIARFPKLDPAAREEAMHIMRAIEDSLRAGVPFEELARRYSDDPGSAANGGRYQGFNIKDLVPEFGAVASTLQPGQISSIFETPFGLHIMRLNSRQGDIIDFNHILIRIDDTRTDPTEAIAFLNTLRDSVLIHHVPFEALARRHSEDEYTKARGGYLVDPRTGERDLPVAALSPAWQRTIDTLQVGEISKPAEAELLDGRNAWHIVWLQQRTPAHRMNLEQDYARIEQLALQEKRQRVMAAWLEKLKESVYIEIRVPTPHTLTSQ